MDCFTALKARLHPSWAGDPLFPTLPLLTSSDVAILTLAKTVTYSKGPDTYHVTRSWMTFIHCSSSGCDILMYVQSPPTPLKDVITFEAIFDYDAFLDAGASLGPSF